MDQYVVKRQFQGLIGTGIAATVLCFVITLVYWPLWGMAAKAIATSIAWEGLQTADAKVMGKNM